MSCDCGAHRRAASLQFDRRKAEQELAAYHRKGPGPTTRRLLEGLREVQATGTLLDIGAGAGALTFELLARGLAQATCVDLAADSLLVTQEEARRRQLSDRIAWHEGDFAEIGAAIPPADIVALDRVICCYPAFAPLLASAAAHCKRWLALSFPRERWLVRAGLALDNLKRRVQGNSFRTFVHPVGGMESLLGGAGFRVAQQSRSLVWHTRIYVREVG
jgi:2-polyprenyl-3-methyl-5-hydroxy-6-metoxy-1,4-benzoquinol methylase